MAEETNVIREQIEETRNSLSENLASLEERIKRTVETAKTTVDDTIEHAKEKFSPTYHVQKRPQRLRNRGRGLPCRLCPLLDNPACIQRLPGEVASGLGLLPRHKPHHKPHLDGQRPIALGSPNTCALRGRGMIARSAITRHPARAYPARSPAGRRKRTLRQDRRPASRTARRRRRSSSCRTPSIRTRTSGTSSA